MSWLISIPIAFISHKLIEHYYPGKFKTAAAMAGWSLLQTCSYIEIKAVVFYKYIRSYFPQRITEAKSMITFIKNGEETDVLDINDFLRLKANNNNDNEFFDISYDFILYEIPLQHHDKYTRYIIRYDDYEHIAKIEYTAINTIKFSVIHFNLKESPEQVTHIHFNDIQFLISGNIVFDRKFVKWYLNKYHSMLISNEDKYNITFIDHTMNYITLDEEKHLLIKNNDYDIITNEEPFTLL